VTGVNDPGGEPIAYTALEAGTPVRSADGEPIGEVAHVLADFESDIFDGLVIDASWLPGGHVFADASLVREIRADAVTLGLDAERCRALPEPTANPAAMEATPDDVVEEGVGDELRDKLRRAWDLISGNY
jgi:hypothetical protein